MCTIRILGMCWAPLRLHGTGPVIVVPQQLEFVYSWCGLPQITGYQNGFCYSPTHHGRKILWSVYIYGMVRDKRLGVTDTE